VGIRTIIRWNKLGLQLSKAKKAIEEGTVDWKKSLKAGCKAMLHLVIGVAVPAVLAVLSDPTAVKAALEGATVGEAFVGGAVMIITGLAGFGLNAWKHRAG
jgi:hypothetical protein